MSDTTDISKTLTKIEHVKEYVTPKGKVVPAHDRVVPIKRSKRKPAGVYDPIAHRRVPAGKRGPKPGKPRGTTAAHARHLYQQLDVPLMLIYALIHNSAPRDPDFEQALCHCRDAITDARTFINRFTSKDVIDE